MSGSSSAKTMRTGFGRLPPVLFLLVAGFSLFACEFLPEQGDRRSGSIRVVAQLPGLGASDAATIELPEEQAREIGVTEVRITVSRDTSATAISI